MYQALYRKWRPRTFDDVVGQEHITHTLKNEVAAGTPSHAYLFCGTRGTGKTTCSKILAKAVNCLHQEDGNPCCACDICRGIDTDSVLDVTEIDAASNSGVDNIRDLREEAHFTPTVGKYRVYIIDECHMLSTGAFNALLKIMEEPPAHVLFILATTEIHKVPATILSRCQRFDFHRISIDSLAGRLLYMAQQEQFLLEEEAAGLIARLSDGGMRDAISLLDLCVSRNSSDAPISADTVMHCAGLLGRDHLFRIGSAAVSGDSGGVFSILEELWEKSIDYQRLCEQLVGFYRDLMLIKSVSDPREIVACLPGELEEYRALSQKLSMTAILAGLTILQDACTRMSRSATRRTELEMAVLKLCHPELDCSPASLLSRLEKLEGRIRAGAQGPAQPSTKQDSTAAPSVEATPSDEEIRRTPVAPFEQWGAVLEVLKVKNLALYGALLSSSAYTGEGLLLVDTGGNGVFSAMMRTDSYAKESLRDAVLSVTGTKYRLGPYNPKKYTVQAADTSKLDAILTKASELGVDVQVK